MVKTKQKSTAIRWTLASLVLALIASMALLAGCASQEQTSSASSSSASSASSSSSAQIEQEADEPEATAKGDLGRVLVAYYSASGNTKAVADEIAETLDADLFEIVPKDPYTEDDLDWTEDGSRVNVEHDDASKRDIELAQVTPDNFAEYDTVILGYPIWWGIAAWPVDGFVSGNDFSGKTVIPFCTSTSSGLGESATQLEELAKGGTWLEGERFSGDPEMSDVREWALGL